MADLTQAQKAMLLESEPCDLTRGRPIAEQEGAGVELYTGAAYSVAKALVRRELGKMTGPGGFLPGMYWNNADGLALRRELRGDPDPDQDDGDEE